MPVPVPIPVGASRGWPKSSPWCSRGVLSARATDSRKAARAFRRSASTAKPRAHANGKPSTGKREASLFASLPALAMPTTPSLLSHGNRSASKPFHARSSTTRAAHVTPTWRLTPDAQGMDGMPVRRHAGRTVADLVSPGFHPDPDVGRLGDAHHLACRAPTLRHGDGTQASPIRCRRPTVRGGWCCSAYDRPVAPPADTCLAGSSLAPGNTVDAPGSRVDDWPVDADRLPAVAAPLCLSWPRHFACHGCTTLPVVAAPLGRSTPAPSCRTGTTSTSASCSRAGFRPATAPPGSAPRRSAPDAVRRGRHRPPRLVRLRATRPLSHGVPIRSTSDSGNGDSAEGDSSNGRNGT